MRVLRNLSIAAGVAALFAGTPLHASEDTTPGSGTPQQLGGQSAGAVDRSMDDRQPSQTGSTSGSTGSSSSATSGGSVSGSTGSQGSVDRDAAYDSDRSSGASSMQRQPGASDRSGAGNPVDDALNQPSSGSGSSQSR